MFIGAALIFAESCSKQEEKGNGGKALLDKAASAGYCPRHTRAGWMMPVNLGMFLNRETNSDSYKVSR